MENTDAQLKIFRDKAARGALTKEDMQTIVQVMRQGRVSAGFASAGAKAKKEPKVKTAKKVLSKEEKQRETELSTFNENTDPF